MGRPLEKRYIGDTTATGSQIQVSARPTAAAAANGYIVKQVSAKRFKCTNANGTAVCKLVTSAPAQGEVRITLTDSAGGTYYASKISGRTATVVAGTGTQFATGSKVRWTFTAVANTVLAIANA